LQNILARTFEQGEIMGDKVDDLLAAVDLLRRRVQAQEQTIAKQAKEIAEQAAHIFELQSGVALLQIRGNEDMGSIAGLKLSMGWVEPAIDEIQEHLWPGRAAAQLAEFRARRERNKLHDDDRTGD
jgi:hypothetical protein